MNERWPFVGKKKYNGSKKRFKLRDRTETWNIFNKRNLYGDVLDDGLLLSRTCDSTELSSPSPSERSVASTLSDWGSLDLKLTA